MRDILTPFVLNYNNQRKALMVFILGYFGLYFLNLHTLPLGWLDEAGYIDPAVNLLQKGKYASFNWRHEGANEFFLAHLPMISVVHLINLSILPIDIYTARLPFAILFMVAMYWFWKVHKDIYKTGFLTAFLVLMLYMLDRGVYEIMRSMRMESIEIALLGPIIYLFYKKKNLLLAAFLCALLFLTHPAVWAISGLIMAYIFFNLQGWGKRLLSAIIFIAPTVIYIALTDFNFDGFYNQLIMHGSEHTADEVPGNLIYNHFIGRFMEFHLGGDNFRWYYTTQPYVIVFNLLTFLYCGFMTYKAVKQKDFNNYFLPVIFLVNQLYWLAVVGPFYRYNVPSLYMMYLMLPAILMWYSNKLKLYTFTVSIKARILIFLVALPFIAYPFVGRNAIALLQRPARTPYPVFNWLDKEMYTPDKKILIVDTDVLNYYAYKYDNVYYSIKHWTCNNYCFADFDEVYMVTKDLEPPNAKLISTYEVKYPQWYEKFIPKKGQQTYDGLKLYRIFDEASMQIGCYKE